MIVKKTVKIGELPKEFSSLYEKNNVLLFRFGSSSIMINRLRTKSTIADINGSLYFFGNSYIGVNPYKSVQSMRDLIEFSSMMSGSMESILKGHLTDISYLCMSDIMNNGKVAEKLLTSSEKVYPDYTVSVFGRDFIDIVIDDELSTIETTSHVSIDRVGHFDLKKLFRAEYLNSLYVVKIAHNRNLDIHGIMNLLPQLELSGDVDVVNIVDNRYFLTICLHIPENMIAKVFAYKLKKRTTTVRLEDLTQLYLSNSVKG